MALTSDRTWEIEMHRKRTVVPVIRLEEQADAPALVVGEIAEIDESGRASVLFPGNSIVPIPARSALTGNVDGDADTLIGASVLLTFENANADRPIIIGLLRDELVSETVISKPAIQPNDERDVLVKGRRVVFEADQEVELRCGKASVNLREDGRIVILGGYVISRSRGVNKIQGGSVQIN